MSQHEETQTTNDGASPDAAPATGPVPPSMAPLVGAVEDAVWKRIEGRLAQIERAGQASDPAAFASDAFREAVAREVAQAGPAGAAGVQEQTKEVVGEVVRSVLFESGIIEKLVARHVEQRVKSAGAGGAATGDDLKKTLSECLPKILDEQIHGVVEKRIQATLSGENMKILIDDKFRAISLYLKSDVIPKTVAKILKESGQPA